MYWLAIMCGLPGTGDFSGMPKPFRLRPPRFPPPWPQPGDIVVVSLIDLPRFAQNWNAREVLRRVSYRTPLPGESWITPREPAFFQTALGTCRGHGAGRREPF